jgi:hypothetical protein
MSVSVKAALSIAACASLCAASYAQEIDECGTLVQGSKCVLFEGGGGRYLLSDYGRFRVGDEVRVVGYVQANCENICGEDADGCVSAAEVYDPVTFPCGEEIPSIEEDLVLSLCDTANGVLVGSGLLGMCLLTRRR